MERNKTNISNPNNRMGRLKITTGNNVSYEKP